MRLSRLASLIGIAAMLFALTALGGGASSHREAPLISQDPAADNTDIYLFRSPDRPDTVTLIANFYPFQAPYGGPNFYRFADDVMYMLNIDNDGDAVQDIQYRFRFRTQLRNPNTFLYNTGPITSLDDQDWNLFQTYDVSRVEFDNDGKVMKETVIGGYLKSPPVNVGPKSTPNYEALAAGAVWTTTEGSRVFAGQRDDPFFVELGGLFDLLTIRKLPGNMGGGVDGLAGHNVMTIAMQVPMTRLTANGAAPASASDANAVIGYWSTTARQRARVLPGESYSGAGGEWTQVSRLGMPLVNEVVVPLGFKDIFNGSQPKDDIPRFAGPVVDPELARLLNALYQVKVPPAPRNDIVTVFATGVPGLNQPANVKAAEMMRLNMMTPVAANPSRLGVLGNDLQGFPNGRRLADDVTDIELRVVAGVLVDGFNIEPNNQLGDGVDANDVPFLPNFPYVGTPHPGYK
jgi:hypothetical protein